jgi:tetratricopeptide (TPR) repeat protein
MSKDTDKSFFILSPFGIQHAAFYQDLIGGISSYEQLGKRLIHLGEQAHAFRQFDRVNEIGQVLFNFPLKQYSSIGAYFLGVALNSCGDGDQDEAKKMFELVVDTAPDNYKAKAILSLAAVSFNTGAYDAALYFYGETIKAAPLDSSSIHAIRTVAMMKGMEGRHYAAVKDLENSYPLIKYAAPHVYFDYLNSYAVELGNAGRKDEARNISRIVLASPFAHAYPEWQDTARDLKEPDRSFVALEPTRNDARNVVHMPVVEHVKSEQVGYNPPSRVTSLQQWKVKMGKDEKPPEILDTRQMILRIVSFFTNKDTPNEKRYQLWEAAQEIMAETDPPDSEPDDSEGA